MQKLYLLLLLILSGCANAQTKKIGIYDWKEYKQMTPISVIDMQESDLLFGNSSSLSALIGDWLFIYDPYEGNQYSLFNLKTKEEKRILAKGNGPGEFLQPTQIFVDEGRQQVKLYERQKALFHTYSFHHAVRGEFRNPISVDDIGDVGYDATICGTNYVQDREAEDLKIFSLKDATGKTLARFGNYPGKSIKGLTDPMSILMLAQSRAIANPKGDVIVTAGRMNDWVAFYQLKDNQPRLIKEYFSIDAEAKIERGANFTRMTHNDKTITAYMRLYPTSKYLYALYSGAYKGYRPPYRYLQVFDWNGNFVKGLRFSERLNSIVVNEKEGKLYGLSKTNDEPRIYVYSLQ